MWFISIRKVCVEAGDDVKVSVMVKHTALESEFLSSDTGYTKPPIMSDQ